LPVLIEQDLTLEVPKDRLVFMEVIRGQLKYLTDELEAPDQELVWHLLKRQRVLVIVDGLSELSDTTRNKIRLLDPEFVANAVIVTSRLEESLDGVRKSTLRPLRIQGNRLSSFMDAYLQRRKMREIFDDTEFFDGCKRLSSMVGAREVTVLLAQLYAEQMIASKRVSDEGLLPANIPDLMLQYINELNRHESGFDDRSVHAAAKTIAWECLRQGYRPVPAKIDDVLHALGGDSPQEQLKYLEQTLRLVQVAGSGRDRVKFALDPLAEYMAALYLVERLRDDSNAWETLLNQTSITAGAPGAIRGLLLALYDCCLAKGAEFNVPIFVTNELGMRNGLISASSASPAESAAKIDPVQSPEITIDTNI
jgi:hypothetical protein